MKLDKTDHAIITQLRSNARLSWQALGKRVHLTGQAVAARVQRLEDAGVISGYTIVRTQAPLHFVTVFMTDGAFDAFEALLRKSACVRAAHKVTGEGCYHLTVEAANAENLESFLNQVLPFGRYKVASSIRAIQ